MNHQPFEDWLLSDEALDPEQETNLRQHLTGCPKCTTLSQALQSVEQEMKRAPQVSPTPGFTGRWQARLAEKRAQKQRRLVWWAIGFNLSAALGIFLALYWNRLASFSFSKMLALALYSITLLFARIGSAQVLLKLFFEEVNPIFPIAFIAVVATGLSVLSLIWIVTMWKIYIPQGVRNEAYN
jgi:anti-sigma factor RsiW